jgi:hypothetical protein
VPAKETSCSGCIVNNIQCVFRHSDERKRPTSKAYVNSLLDRITLLEKTILDLGQPLPTSGCSSQGPISFNDAGASNTSPGKPTDAFIPGETAAQPLVKSSIRQAFDTFYNVMGYEDINHALENSPADRDTGTELLEICVLAMGSHLARSTDNELRKQAKIRLDMEFHHRKSFPLVRACSIISDLELAMGDLNSSREYSNKMIEILRNIIEKPAAPIDEASHWELARDLVVSCRLRNHFWSTFRNHPLDFSSIEEMASQSAQQISSLESNHRPLSYREGVGNFGDRFRELTSLVEGILRNFYQPATESSPLRSLLKFDRKLHSWYTKLPSAFKLSADTTIHSTKFFLLQ